MKKEDIIILLFGVQVLMVLFYIPETIKGIYNIWENGDIFFNIGYILQTLSFYGFCIIGIVGVYSYYQNKNIFNPLLKIYFIYDLFSFLVRVPNTFFYLLSEEVELHWQFYFFQILNFSMIIFVVLIYSKEQLRVKENPVKKNVTRFNHFFIDMVFLTLITIQTYNSFHWFEDFIGDTIYNILFTLFAPYILYVLYYWVSETIFQQTLGKVFTKKYVRRIDGHRAGMGKILGRSLCRLIPFEPFSYLSSPPNGWHDSLTNTNVFERSEEDIEDDIIEHLVSEYDG